MKFQIILDLINFIKQMIISIKNSKMQRGTQIIKISTQPTEMHCRFQNIHLSCKTTCPAKPLVLQNHLSCMQNHLSCVQNHLSCMQNHLSCMQNHLPVCKTTCPACKTTCLDNKTSVFLASCVTYLLVVISSSLIFGKTPCTVDNLLLTTVDPRIPFGGSQINNTQNSLKSPNQSKAAFSSVSLLQSIFLIIAMPVKSELELC